MKKILISVAAALMLMACSNNLKNKTSNGTDAGITTANNPDVNASHSETGADDCYVWLFDGDNFTDDKVQITGPAELSSLKSVPGSTKDWDDEADALKVGPSSTVTIWKDQNFQGESVSFQGGEEIPKLKFEPKSLKIMCK